MQSGEVTLHMTKNSTKHPTIKFILRRPSMDIKRKIIQTPVYCGGGLDSGPVVPEPPLVPNYLIFKEFWEKNLANNVVFLKNKTILLCKFKPHFAYSNPTLQIQTPKPPNLKLLEMPLVLKTSRVSAPTEPRSEQF